MVILIAAYAPEFLSGSNSGETKSQLAPSPEASPEVTFEFDNLLRNSKVTADPGAYEVQGQTDEPGSIEYLIQAASFRHEAEAESLRAQLLLQDLPASMTSTRLDNAVWYRVTVGPFDSQVLAQRALTRLREQNLDALYIRRRKPT
jgi:cell division protein FtsN